MFRIEQAALMVMDSLTTLVTRGDADKNKRLEELLAIFSVPEFVSYHNNFSTHTRPFYAPHILITALCGYTRSALRGAFSLATCNQQAAMEIYQRG